MHTRLGPQTLNIMGKLYEAMAHEAYLSPLTAPIITDWLPHMPTQQPVGGLTNRGPPGFASRRLDDMFSTLFTPDIITYEPPRGFIIPKFSAFDGSSDPFDHIMHYRQLMTLDIGNDTLLCKVFPASLQGQALSWFHRLSMNFVDNFRDLSEAFVGQYLCSAWHKKKHQYLVKCKNAGEWIIEGVCKAVWAGCTSSRIL